MKIRLLGAHNTESQDTKCISLLIDGILAIDAGGLTSSLSFEAQQGIKALLLTHYHYDHVKDIPAIGMNLSLRGGSLDIYSTLPVYETVSAYLLDGKLYVRFLERPEEKPAFRYTIVEPGKAEQIEGYSVLPVSVDHAVPAVGYQVSSADGGAIFYTGDTGPGLAGCWKSISPQLLLIEVTMPNRLAEFAASRGHLAPVTLKEELLSFRELKGYLPQMIAVHLTPGWQKEIEAELAAVADELNTPIAIGYEGMEVDL
ncbi:MBL fold metallo-hydrolase [Chloroflexota bacterium]